MRRKGEHQINRKRDRNKTDGFCKIQGAVRFIRNMGSDKGMQIFKTV